MCFNINPTELPVAAVTGCNYCRKWHGFQILAPIQTKRALLTDQMVTQKLVGPFLRVVWFNAAPQVWFNSKYFHGQSSGKKGLTSSNFKSLSPFFVLSLYFSAVHYLRDSAGLSARLLVYNCSVDCNICCCYKLTQKSGMVTCTRNNLSWYAAAEQPSRLDA